MAATLGVIAYSTPDTIATFAPVLCGFFFVQVCCGPLGRISVFFNGE